MSTLQNQGCKMSFLQFKYQETLPTKERHFKWEGNQGQNWIHPPGKLVSPGQELGGREVTTAAQSVKVGSQQTEARHFQVSATKQRWQAKVAIRKFVLPE